VSSQGPNTHDLKAKLNGNHVFILGNHDKNNGNNTPLKYGVIQSYGKTILLIHRPEDALILMEKLNIDLAFVGHVHEKWMFKNTEHGDIVNVGVDQWDFYPVDAKQILKSYKKWKQEKE